jgi:hypothetical protein
MSAALHETFIGVLRAGRADFNDRFKLARRAYQALEPRVFSDFLGNVVDPWLRAALLVRPECGPDIVTAGYDAGLSLVGQRLVGAGAPAPDLEALLAQLLAGAARLSVLAPRRFVVAACNALHQLTRTPGANAALWVAELQRLSPALADFEQWLRVGQVLAWRAGLAHYRASALRVADALPPELAVAAVGGAPGTAWVELRAALLRDPWLVPAQPEHTLRLAREMGAFRGFGGLFRTPPLVARTSDAFVVESDGDAWLLYADAFGGTFQRVKAGERHGGVAEHAPPPGLEFQQGALLWRGERLALPSPGAITSFSANQTTVACTFAASHAVALIALPS